MRLERHILSFGYPCALVYPNTANANASAEDDGRGGEATVLPFSSYGAMGWARDEYEANSGSSQFFWLLFDSDLTPAGKNVLDGRYPCFGYVTEGSDFLRDIKEGDVIVEAKVVDGADRITYQ